MVLGDDAPWSATRRRHRSSAASPRRCTGARAIVTLSRVVEGRDRRRRSRFQRRTVDVVPPGIDPTFSPGGEQSRDAARRGRRPARAGEALRPADPRRRRRSRAATRPHAHDRRRGLRTRAARRARPRGRRRRLGRRSPATCPTTSSSTSTAGVARRQRVGPRGLGHDAHRGGRVRHAGGRHPHPRPHRRRGRRRDRPARRPRRRDELGDAIARPVADDDRLRERLRTPRRRARRQFTWEATATGIMRALAAEAERHRR